MLECLKTNSKRSFKCYGKIDVKYRYCNKTGEVTKGHYLKAGIFGLLFLVVSPTTGKNEILAKIRNRGVFQ